MRSVFLAIAASYMLVAILGVTVGRVWAEIQHREAAFWPAAPDVDWSAPDRIYDWAEEGVLL